MKQSELDRLVDIAKAFVLLCVAGGIIWLLWKAI